MSHRIRLAAMVALIVLSSGAATACGPSRPERPRPATPAPRAPLEGLCDLLDGLPRQLINRRTRVVDLLDLHGDKERGTAGALVYARFMTDARLGPYDPALQYLVSLYQAEEDGRRRPEPTPQVVASARAIDREIARGRCR